MKLSLLDSDMRGFTLVELMVALAIGSIIVIGISSAYTSQQRINQSQDQIVEMQQNLRAGLDMMTRELRMAGFDPDGIESVGFRATDVDANPSTNVTSVTFAMRVDGDGRDNDSDGERDEDDEYTNTGAGDVTLISYSFQDAYGDGDRDGDGVVTCGNGVDICDLARQVDNGPSIALIENVENVEFLYILENGEARLNPKSWELSDIRSVKISVLVRSSGISLNYTDTVTYRPASFFDAILQPIFWIPNNITSVWNTGPFNDSFRRRMQIITIDCRNML